MERLNAVFSILFFFSRACKRMSRYLEKLLTDFYEIWHTVEAR